MGRNLPHQIILPLVLIPTRTRRRNLSTQSFNHQRLITRMWKMTMTSAHAKLHAFPALFTNVPYKIHFTSVLLLKEWKEHLPITAVKVVVQNAQFPHQRHQHATASFLHQSQSVTAVQLVPRFGSIVTYFITKMTMTIWMMLIAFFLWTPLKIGVWARKDLHTAVSANEVKKLKIRQSQILYAFVSEFQAIKVTSVGKHMHYILLFAMGKSLFFFLKIVPLNTKELSLYSYY